MLLPEEVTRLINRDDAQVIDIRPQNDFENGHIIDALHINVDDLSNQVDKLKKYKDKGLIICCASGAVSVKEARKLINEGFEKAYCLKGGMMSWQQANLPLTKGSK